MCLCVRRHASLRAKMHARVRRVFVCARKPVAWNMLGVGFTVCVRRLRECGACAWTAWMLFVVCTTWERACVRNKNKMSSVLPEPTGKKSKKSTREGIEPSTDRSKTQHSPTSLRGNHSHSLSLNHTYLEHTHSPKNTHKTHTITLPIPQFTSFHYGVHCYYFPSQKATFVFRVLRSKMNGSRRSLGVGICFRPCRTRWSGRIRVYMLRYTRTRHHWCGWFLATQTHQPTRTLVSSCTKLSDGTTQLL